jgi:hypothetical protein
LFDYGISTDKNGNPTKFMYARCSLGLGHAFVWKSINFVPTGENIDMDITNKISRRVSEKWIVNFSIAIFFK